MKIIKTSDIYIKPIDESGDFEDEDEDDGHDLNQSMDQADSIFKEVHIRPSLNSKYSYIAIADNKVVGGILSNWDTNNSDMVAVFSWDIAVHPDYQNKGVGKKLINEIMSKYESEKYEYQEMEYNTEMRVEVLNENLANYLERIGFEVSSEYPDRKYMFKY